MKKPQPLSARLGLAWNVLRGHRQKRDGYDAAQVTRLLADWIASRLAPDDEIRWSLAKLRSRARDLERNNPFVKQYLRLLSVNVIGPVGINLDPRVRLNSGALDLQVNEKIEDAWELWGHQVTIDGRLDLATFQRNAIKTVARDGEVLVRLWRGFERNEFNLALELIDPDLLDESYTRAARGRDNEIRMGVEIDKYGSPVAYHIWNRQQGLIGASERTRFRISADEILHIYDPERANQSRGVTWMAPIMVPVKHLGSYFESELVGARIGAAKMGFFQRKTGEPGTLPDDGSGNFTTDADPGAFGILPDGYELATFDPNHPNTAFDSFVKGALRQIASGLGCTYNSLANDLENVNYSSMRSGLLVERDAWRTIQRWWIEQFLRPVYREWMNSALLSGKLKLGSRVFTGFLAANWSPRGWSWVDPAKDTQAGITGIQSGLASRQALLAEQGESVEDVFEQLAEEQKLATEMGIDIKGPGVAAPAAADPNADGSGDGAASGNGKGGGRTILVDRLSSARGNDRSGG